MLRSVKLNGRDITDTPLDISKGATPLKGLQLFLSPTTAHVTGDVVDSHGAPLADCTVVVFAEDRARWEPGTRFVKVARPDQDGRFAISGLPTGRYLIVARDFVEDGQWEDPAFLQSLVVDAARLTLREGATQEVSLKFEMP
jgi:hypothetical protein